MLHTGKKKPKPKKINNKTKPTTKTDTEKFPVTFFTPCLCYKQQLSISQRGKIGMSPTSKMTKSIITTQSWLPKLSIYCASPLGWDQGRTLMMKGNRGTCGFLFVAGEIFTQQGNFGQFVALYRDQCLLPVPVDKGDVFSQQQNQTFWELPKYHTAAGKPVNTQ